MRKPRSARTYSLCVRNDGYPASLLVRRLYERVPDRNAAARGLLRIVDESGEDYLYPEKFFVPIALPKQVTRAMRTAA
jgi:hypothetical protein